MSKGIKQMGKRDGGAKCINGTVQVDRTMSLIITKQLQQKRKSTPYICIAIPPLTASLCLVTDTLNCNSDCAYVNDFPSQLKTSAWVRRRPLLKRQQSLWGAGGEALLWMEGFLGFEPRMVMFKVKCRLSRGEN